jgi:hypothetical protein
MGVNWVGTVRGPVANESGPTRRRVLATLAASGALAGCFGQLSAGSDERSTPTLTPAPAPADTPRTAARTRTPVDIAQHGIPPDVCEESIQSDPGIYAITEPAFAGDWSGREIGIEYRHDRDRPELVDEQTVVGLTDGDRARAYPLSVLTVHEVVNDSFGGPVAVTYCPLCRSGLVAERRVGGEVTQFAVSGLLWQPERVREAASEEADRVFGARREGGDEVSVRHNGNLVMYDAATRSYWSQILARAICGPETGDRLSIRASTLSTWGEWLETHPETEVLLPPPYSGAVDPGVLLGDDPA